MVNGNITKKQAMLTRTCQIFGESYFILYWIILIGLMPMSGCLQYDFGTLESCCCTQVLGEQEGDSNADGSDYTFESSYDCNYTFMIDQLYYPCQSNPCPVGQTCVEYGEGYTCEPNGIYLSNLYDDYGSTVICESPSVCNVGPLLDDFLSDSGPISMISNTKSACTLMRNFESDIILQATINNREQIDYLTVHMHVCKYEDESYDERNGENTYYYILSNGACPKTWNSTQFPTEYCPQSVAATSVIPSTVIPTVKTVTSSAVTTSAASLPDEITLAAGIAAASIVVFIVALVLFLVCYRRVSYRLRRNKKPVVSPQLVENSAYISVGNGIAASANNIPVYSKPMKGQHAISNGAGNNQQQLDSGYEEAPVVKPRESEYAEATLSPIRGLQDDVKPPATPPRPHSTARLSDGYEQATPSSDFKTPLADSSGYEDNFVTPATAITNSGYEDNFVTPAGSGYEENFVTPQTGIKESIRYDHLKRKIDLDGNDSMNKETDGRYGQVRPKSADSVKYQHLTHDRKPAPADSSYGRLDKERKS